MLTADLRKNSLRRWEQALLLGLAFALLLGLWLDRQQTLLADKVVRLHIVANSDSAEDQALKLQVRDRILAEAEGMLSAGGLLETKTSIEAHLQDLTALAAEAVRAEGYDYEVRASLEESWFPTKEYGSFAFPAGKYTALRIVIGEGGGQNWWCVVFPPLCMNTVTGSVAETASEGGLTDDQVSLITGENEGYLIKFKAIELWRSLQRRWTENNT
jgi:stage II sporulation protein R